MILVMGEIIKNSKYYFNKPGNPNLILFHKENKLDQILLLPPTKWNLFTS